jgi:hypothetical protein
VEHGCQTNDAGIKATKDEHLPMDDDRVFAGIDTLLFAQLRPQPPQDIVRRLTRFKPDDI